jgi:hypothetical protein
MDDFISQGFFFGFLAALVIATVVYIDARNLQKKGYPIFALGWAITVFFVMIISLPLYLIRRSRVLRGEVPGQVLELVSERQHCPNCGTDCSKQATFCTGCGKAIASGRIDSTLLAGAKKQPSGAGLYVIIGITFLALIGGVVLNEYFITDRRSSIIKAVRVNGDFGIAYSGSCIIWLNGTAHSEEYHTTTPDSYIYHADVVSCAFQKDREDRKHLHVEIVDGEDDRVIVQADTTQPFGTLTVATR